MAEASVALRNVGGFIQNAALWPELIFNNPCATSDLLQLVQKFQKVTNVFRRIIPLDLISRGVSPIANFISAIDLPRSFRALFSGKAANDNPLLGGTNVLNVVKTICTIVQEIACSLWWLVSVKILDEWVEQKTVGFGLSNRRFVVLDGICDLATIVGSTCSIVDSIRLMVQEGNTGPYRLIAGHKVSNKLIGRCLDVATDVCMIASAVLSNIPSISVAYAGVAAGVGLIISLGNFLDKQNHQTAAAA